MSYTKFCNKCGQRISLREMQGGQWVAFDVNTDKVHKHSKKQGKVKNSNKYSNNKKNGNNEDNSLGIYIVVGIVIILILINIF